MGVTTTTRSSDASKKLTVLLFSIVLFGFCSVPSTLAFLHFATWNVRGISQEYSQHLAADDCNRYNLDVIALHLASKKLRCLKTQTLLYPATTGFFCLTRSCLGMADSVLSSTEDLYQMLSHTVNCSLLLDV